MLERLFKGLRSVLYWFSVAAMSVMLVVIFAQVISRYVFNWTPEWSEELARYLFVWVTFIGSALIMGESGHLAVQFVPNHFKGTAVGKALEVLINLCGYVFIFILFFQGAKMTRVMTFQISPGMEIPMSWVYAVIPLSSALMLLYLVKDTVRIVKGFSGPGGEGR
ncbi:MAG: TRAP transporter small permease [Syntrophobacterales bacterium]|nr:TRAP transporter small permease [Syntrophobacterales bacterium]HQM90291.1 TRAP transporter small permease [Syntrophales bacterium]HQM90328.1 TRAP transporter small permease [Syntrophales bacterium]